MAISVSLKLSADSGNLLSLGADSGLYASSPTPRGGPYGYTYDNSAPSAAAGATYYYWPPQAAVTGYTWLANTAQLTPLVVSRDCRVTEAAISVTTAGAGSQINQTLYASDAAGGVAGKIADLLRFDTTATGMRQATALSTPTVLTGGKLYWTATWASTSAAYPTTPNRSSVGMLWSLRLADRPQQVAYFNGAVQSYAETVQAWSGLASGPTSLTPTLPVGTVAPTATYATASLICYGLLNV